MFQSTTETHPLIHLCDANGNQVCIVISQIEFFFGKEIHLKSGKSIIVDATFEDILKALIPQ